MRMVRWPRTRPRGARAICNLRVGEVQKERFFAPPKNAKHEYKRAHRNFVPCPKVSRFFGTIVHVKKKAKHLSCSQITDCTSPPRSGSRPADHSHAETAPGPPRQETFRNDRFRRKTPESQGLRGSLPRGPSQQLIAETAPGPPRGAPKKGAYKPAGKKIAACYGQN